jgi:hypothetical protein
MSVNWAEPTEEMMAALGLARRCSNRAGLTETQLAEWIITARESLWYFQARRWAEDPPSAVHETARPMFQMGCKLLLKIVDLGYDPERKQWWPVQKLFDGEDERGGAMLVLMDFGTMTKRLPDVAEWPEGTYDHEVILGTVQRGFTTTSAGFQVFVSMMCGPQWERRYAAMMTAMEQAKRLGTTRRTKG